MGTTTTTTTALRVVVMVVDGAVTAVCMAAVTNSEFEAAANKEYEK